MEEDESKLKQIKSREKLSRDAKYLFKAYERDIPTQQTEIVKLKSELKPLKKQEEQKNRLLDLQERAAHYRVPTRIIKDAIASKKFLIL